MIENQLLLEQKSVLRRTIAEARRNLSPDRRAEASRRARELLVGQPEWRSAQFVLFYYPLVEELDIWPLAEAALRDEKRIALPRFEAETKDYSACEIAECSRDIVIGNYGIGEPGLHCRTVASNSLDFILVPGVAFDMYGHRLGRGKGYYDRLLSATTGTKCGVAFDEQVVPAVPVDPHDVDLNCILTPTRWARF